MEGLGELISKISKVWGSFLAKVGKIARMQCMTAPLLKLLKRGLETFNRQQIQGLNEQISKMTENWRSSMKEVRKFMDGPSKLRFEKIQ